MSSSIGFDIRSPTGTLIYSVSTAYCENPAEVTLEKGKHHYFEFHFRSCLNAGPYFLSLGMAEFLSGFENKDHYTIVKFVADALTIEAKSSSVFAGLVNLRAKLITSTLTSDVLEEGK